MTSIYDLDVYYVSEKLTPPELRTSKRLDWINTLLTPIQKKHNEGFGLTDSFKTGLLLLFWNNANFYNIGDQVRVGIARYENLNPGSGVFPVGNPNEWLLIETDFVGTDIRKNIYAGKMSMEFILNLYFNTTPTTTPTIYIQTQGSATPTMMMNNDSSPFLNYMPSDSLFSQIYMASISTYYAGLVNFFVYVPNAIFLGLGVNTADRKNTVRGIVDRYNTAGMTYDIIPY